MSNEALIQLPDISATILESPSAGLHKFKFISSHVYFSLIYVHLSTATRLSVNSHDGQGFVSLIEALTNATKTMLRRQQVP
jgi:hypothetical protein